jgi:hypothetical protein
MVGKLKIVKVNAAADPSGLVDSGFNNPIGSSNTYGVVGGTTGTTGQQVLPVVAIGKPAAGTIYTTSGSNVAYGMVTSMSDLSANSALATRGNGSNVDIGLVDAVESGILLAITNTIATGSFIKTSGNIETSGGEGTPVWFDTAFSTIAVNTPYYIKSIANATHFTVSTSLGGANVAVGTVNGITANLNQQAVTLVADATATYTNQDFQYADGAAGYILRQKGKRKFLVADSTTLQDEDIVAGLTYRITSVSGTDWTQYGAGPDAAVGKIFTATINGSDAVLDDGTVNLVGTCKTANLANTSLTVNTMNLVATKDPSGTVNLDSMTSKHAIDFTAAAGVNDNAGTHYYASTNGAVAADASAGIKYMVVDVRTS